MQRLDAYRVRIDTPQIPITLFAKESVFVDRASVGEIQSFATIIDTIEQLKRVGFLDRTAAINGIILTPDFHKGAGIPIGIVFDSAGFVVPRAVGSDIGCGMRFLMTDVTRDEFDALGDRLDQIIRYIFFEGGRNIPLSRRQREAIFWGGLPRLAEERHTREGIFAYWDGRQQRQDAERVHLFGALPVSSLFELEDFIRGSGTEYTRDDQIGSIGGGNHFVELQSVEEVYDRHRSYDWGIEAGRIAIMVHSGSVGIGHQVGNHFTDKARAMYPTGLRHHDHYVLPAGEAATDYLSAMGNAANFAFANRLFLGLMMVRALSESIGRRIYTRLVYDAPHNLIWAGDTYLHRKGACPAEHAVPVIIPGSMGSDSFILVGEGSPESYCSACHGAGRSRPRQQSRARADEPTCRVVTKIDPRRVRRNIRDEHMRALAEEAPDRYKAISPVIETVEGAGIARRVARTFPLLTVKGL
jgi:tRNA-splicing ligase RtcB